MGFNEGDESTMKIIKNSNRCLAIFMFLAVSLLSLAACSGGVTDSMPLSEESDVSAQDLAAPTETPNPEVASTETSVSTDLASSSGEKVSFANDVLPIFNSRCLQCHGGDEMKVGLSLASYAAVMAGSEKGPVVVPGESQSSKLIELVVNGSMPKRGPDLFPDQIKILIDWVNAGAIDN